MGEIKNPPKGVKSDVPEGVSISCPTCDTRHDLRQITDKFGLMSQYNQQSIGRRCTLVWISPPVGSDDPVHSRVCSCHSWKSTPFPTLPVLRVSLFDVLFLSRDG